MTEIFRPDPVLVQKGRVNAAIAGWREARKGVNDPESLPPRLDAIIDLVARAVDPVRPEFVASLDALHVELRGLVFVDDPEETLRGLEEKTLLVQAALDNLRQAAARAGYEQEIEEDAALPAGLRIPAQAIADRLGAMEEALLGLKNKLEKISEQQTKERSDAPPPLQAPLVANFIERANVKVDISLIKLQGKLIDVTGLARMAGDTRRLITDFLSGVSDLPLRAGHWLKAEAPVWLKPAGQALGESAGAIIRRTIDWVKRKEKRPERQPQPEPAATTPPADTDPGPPPPDFNLKLVHEMILRGEAPPKAWVPWIRDLNFGITAPGDLVIVDKEKLADLTPLGSLTSLEFLFLTNTQVSDLTQIKDLKSLQSLGLYKTLVSDILPLTGLTGLEWLELGDTQVGDIAAIAGLTRLQYLNLNDTKVSDIAPLAGITSLQDLGLSNTQVRNIAPLAGLTSLKNLDLKGTQISDIAPLAGLAKLDWLGLEDTRISDITPLAGRTSLKTLYLGDTQVSDIAALSGLTSLQDLDLGLTSVSDIARLAGLTRLQHLNLWETEVSDIAPLAGLTSLQTLYLHNTPVTDLSPLRDLPNLTHVQVENLGRARRLARTLGKSGVVTTKDPYARGTPRIRPLKPRGPRSTAKRLPGGA